MALAVMVSLLAVPVAAAVGTAVHDSRRDIYAQQHHTRHLVTATITDDTAAHNISRTNNATMAVQLVSSCRQPNTPARSGAIGDQARRTTSRSGSTTTGALTNEPTPTTRAGADAVTAALFTWARASQLLRRSCWPVPGQCVTVSAPPDGNTPSTHLIGRDGHKPSQP